MATEIERKFLPANDGWRGLDQGQAYCQGYLCSGAGRTVRVRTASDRGYLTIKGPTLGFSRSEYEYPIPLGEARELLDNLCMKPLIEKIRYRISYAGFVWEIDEFKGENDGLVVAEIELEYPEQEFVMPPWIGREVTDDPRYRNSSLALNPYRNWYGR
jgi:adenylate cyclase